MRIKRILAPWRTPLRPHPGHKTHGNDPERGSSTRPPRRRSSRPRSQAPGVSSIARVSSTRADRARPMATQPHFPWGCWIFAGRAARSRSNNLVISTTEQHAALPYQGSAGRACDGHGMAQFATMLEFRPLSLADPLIGIRFHPSISGSALKFVRRCQRIAAVGATARAVLERHERSRDPIVLRGRVRRPDNLQIDPLYGVEPEKRCLSLPCLHDQGLLLTSPAIAFR